MVKIEGYTTREIVQSQGVSRKTVHAWARDYKWQVVGKVGNANVYHHMNVEAFLDARRRTRLLREAGWRDGRPGQGLVWYDDLDVECPKCGAMAVERPARTPEEAQETPPVYCEQCGVIR